MVETTDHDLLIRLDSKVDNLTKKMEEVYDSIKDYPVTKNRLLSHLSEHKSQSRRQLSYLSLLAGSVSTLIYILAKLLGS